ncbi:MAG: hypothetical protein V1701_06715 [Planctomycetota bacterium]
MKKILFIGSFILATALITCAEPAKDEPLKKVRPKPAAIPLTDVNDDTDLIAYMLKSRGLTRQTACIDPQILESLYNQNKMVMPHFLRYWKSPYDFPKFACSILRYQEESAAKDTALFDLFGQAQARTGHRVAFRPEFMRELKPDKDNPVLEAMKLLVKECQSEMNNADRLCPQDAIPLERDRAALESVFKDVPVELQAQVARMLLNIKEAKSYRDRALRNYPRERLAGAFNCAASNFTVGDENPSAEPEDGTIVNWDLGQALDYDDLFTGAALCIKSIMDMEKSIADCSRVLTETNKVKLDLSNVSFEFATPLGKVAFNAKPEDNTYQGEDYLLIIDLAGNDTYKGAVAASYSLTHPVSIVIDNSGNDTYIADKGAVCAQGAGILGYGFLVDNGGNDAFTAVNNAQGMCYFGVGILCARGGDDTFKAHTSAQGAASFGIANLIKIGGNDSYYAYYTSQGFGFVGGFGLLLDTGGNDKYVAEPYDLVHAATGGHDNMRNYSFCQGAGWGQRGDIYGGHAMGGGMGILQDLSGDDSYQCGVFAQATGYWYGTGILHDKAGNDSYEGSFFVQSGTAHMGMTLLLDEAGNDKYHVWHHISMAGAHDVSVNWLIDKGGDDIFSAWEWKDEKGGQSLKETGVKGPGGTVLGSSITNSVSVFVNIGGNDTYEVYAKETFGWCQQRESNPLGWRYDAFNVGIFIDVGGKDNYILHEQGNSYADPADNCGWTRTSPPGNPDKTFSMGIDIDKGRVPEAEF